MTRGDTGNDEGGIWGTTKGNETTRGGRGGKGKVTTSTCLCLRASARRVQRATSPPPPCTCRLALLARWAVRCFFLILCFTVTFYSSLTVSSLPLSPLSPLSSPLSPSTPSLSFYRPLFSLLCHSVNIKSL